MATCNATRGDKVDILKVVGFQHYQVIWFVFVLKNVCIFVLVNEHSLNSKEICLTKQHSDNHGHFPVGVGGHSLLFLPGQPIGLVPGFHFQLSHHTYGLLQSLLLMCQSLKLRGQIKTLFNTFSRALFDTLNISEHLCFSAMCSIVLNYPH